MTVISAYIDLFIRGELSGYPAFVPGWRNADRTTLECGHSSIQICWNGNKGKCCYAGG